MKTLLLASLLVGSSVSFATECLEVGEGAVRFEIIQDGSPFRGEFHQYGGEICLASEGVEHLAVWLLPTSVDTGLPELDAALQEPEFFDSTRHPRMLFRSDAIKGQGEQQRAQGALHVKGRKVALNVPFILQVEQRRVSGELVIDRLALGIGTGEWSDTRWLGREVTVTFEAALVADQG